MELDRRGLTPNRVVQNGTKPRADVSQRLQVKVFADGADVDGMLRLATDPRITGFTPNPTLMRKSGIAEYEGFARKVLDHIVDQPISFEVFSDEFSEMARQARRIASW